MTTKKEEKVFCDSIGEYRLPDGRILTLHPVMGEDVLIPIYTTSACIGIYEDLNDGVMGDDAEIDREQIIDLIEKLQIIADGKADEYYTTEAKKEMEQEKEFYSRLCKFLGVPMNEFITYSKKYEEKYGVNPTTFWMRYFMLKKAEKEE